MRDKLKKIMSSFKMKKILEYIKYYLLVSFIIILMMMIVGIIEMDKQGKSLIEIVKTSFAIAINYYYNIQLTPDGYMGENWFFKILGYILSMIANLVLAGWIAYRIIWKENILEIQNKLYIYLENDKLKLKFRAVNMDWEQSDLVDIKITLTLYKVENSTVYREKWTSKKEKEFIYVSTAFSYEFGQDNETDLIKFIQNSLKGKHQDNKCFLFVATFKGVSTQNGQIHSLKREFYSKDLLFGNYKEFYGYEEINGEYKVRSPKFEDFNWSTEMSIDKKRELDEYIERLKIRKPKEPVVIADKININFNNEKNNYALKIRIGNEDWKTHSIVGAKMKLELFCVKHNKTYERIWEHSLERELICQSATFRYNAQKNINEDLKNFIKNAFLKNIKKQEIQENDYVLVFSLIGVKTDNKQSTHIGLRKEYYIEDIHFGGYSVFYDYKKENGRYFVDDFDIKKINKYRPFTEEEKSKMEEFVVARKKGIWRTLI